MDQHSQDNVQTDYAMSCERARQRSINSPGCGIHVNALVAVTKGLVYIAGFEVTDWYVEGSTVATYIDGER